jgi:hypothetical protein
MSRRAFVLTVALFLFNVLCNAIVAFAAFGVVPATKEWKWDRASSTFWDLLGGAGGALITIVVTIVITTVIVKAVDGRPDRTFMGKVGFAFMLLLIIIVTAVFADDMFYGSAMFFGIFAAIFAVETFVEHWISNKLLAAKEAAREATATA